MKIQDIVLKESRSLDIIDNRNGLGSVPNNQDIDHFGLRVLMKPSTFLELAKRGDRGNTEYMIDYLEDGGRIGAPMLFVEVPKEWFEQDDRDAYHVDDDMDDDIKAMLNRQNQRERERKRNASPEVEDHEGRHRMKAILEVYGDQPVEVHIFFKGGVSRRRHLTDVLIQTISQGIESENGRLIRHPFEDILN